MGSWICLALAGCATDGDGDGDTGVDPNHQHVNGACLVDSDCGAAFNCTLGVCTQGCLADSECLDDEVCDPHGYCVGEDGEPPPAPAPDPGQVSLSDDTIELDDTGIVSVALSNTSEESIRYRLEANSDAVTVESGVQTIGAGQQAQLSISVDKLALSPDVRQVGLSVITDGGTLDLVVEVPQEATGFYIGNVAFSDQTATLGVGALEADIEFNADGTITGRTAPESMLWPEPVELWGSWDAEAGTVELHIDDVIPDAAGNFNDSIESPFGREVGREIVLEGVFDEDGRGMEGTVVETLTGLVGEEVTVEGSFRFNYMGRLHGLPTGTDFSGELPLPAPTPGVPEALETEDVCEGLGVDYGTPERLTEQLYVDSCDACSLGADGIECTEAMDAVECGLGLLVAGANITAALPDNQGDALSPPDPNIWSQCTAEIPEYGDDGTTCHDAAAIACAGRLARYGTDNIAQADPDFLFANALVLLQLERESQAGAILATDLMVQAAFAYQENFPGSVLQQEVTLLTRAEEGLMRPMVGLASFDFIRGLETLGKDIVIDDREGNDLRRALTVGARYAEVLAIKLRLEHLDDPSVDESKAANVRHFAVWTHVTGALWKHEFEVFELDDTLGELSIFGEQVDSLRELWAELANPTNPWGFTPEYVPMLLQPNDIAAGKTNFEVMWESSQDDIAQYEEIAILAEQAEEEFWNNAWSVSQQINEVENGYDERLGQLCGFDDNADPDLETCGEKGGAILEQLQVATSADIELQGAKLSLENGNKRIGIEEFRMSEIILNHEETEGLIEDGQEEIFRIQNDANSDRSAKRSAAARQECGTITKRAVVDGLELAGECAVDAAKAAGPQAAGVAAGCTVKAAALAIDAAISCDDAKEKAGIENDFAEIDANETRGIQVVNNMVDAALRASAIENQVTDSKALIENLELETTELSNFVDLQANNANLAQTQVMNLISQVAVLQTRKQRAVKSVSDNPNNPGTSPKFLLARLELGRNVLRWREIAQRRGYLAGRALEYEINQPASSLRRQLLEARSPFEIGQYMTCLDKVHEDYQLEFGQPQQHVTEISIRDNVLGLDEVILDEVTGEEASPGEQFRAFLALPDHRRADGSIEFPISFSLVSDQLFSTLLCDDRIESLQVKVVGDFIGDNEIDIVIARAGTSSVRRCDSAGLAASEAIVKYELDDRQTLISSGANDFGLSMPNGGLTGWPVGGEQWIVTIPSGEVSPANADLDLASVSDIVIRLNHRAATVGQSGVETFVPTCN